MQETVEAICYELDEGGLLVTPSPTLRHNEIRARIHEALRAFSKTRKLGHVTSETDFLLAPGTVRGPDVAFLATNHLSALISTVLPSTVLPFGSGGHIPKQFCSGYV